jgi:hypothetical protein
MLEAPGSSTIPLTQTYIGAYGYGYELLASPHQGTFDVSMPVSSYPETPGKINFRKNIPR